MNQWISGQRLIQRFEEWVPESLAFENDKIGLLIGTLNKDIKKVMVTLDVLENVAQEAADKHVDLIIAHHPVIFHPLKNVRSDAGQGKIVTKCVKHDVAVYAAHTNLDIAEGGVNDMLAKQLGLRRTQILKPTQSEPLYKLTVYVPESHIQTVRKAIGDAGAGAIGRYSHCTFTARGKGTFLPEEGTHPYIGAHGKLAYADEGRIETIVPEHLLKKVISRMLKVHPYEEVAYDVYPLKNEGVTYGLGRIGELEEPAVFGDYCREVKQKLGVDGLRAVGNLKDKVRKIAVCGGDGNSLIPYARYRGADVLISGDIYYHTAHDALLAGLKVIDAGHHIESVMKKGVQHYLQKVIKEEGCDTEVIVSDARTNPFRFF
ncbi:Nif3-like dinuclear metal center hexameric protein [Sporolactobacillus sp. THM19-2]|jgi:dinuclear metal center YbgI/SA1388 family protein|uniref:Nif3-like dinuclear metal center hexameric protein n=1 Tax=Sporolactobacillus sp. THM19-2 TaxID=2511171 RepID=UPI0010217B11|nr:Nif3-like dinuclear metal center hexameric protein [Sporolactobacillus sp. THM19-2]RYL90414.1 Nif3-like dinuclear metal center hexameric protein [Sporolactobacillus sp. THM19-2]